MTTYQITHIIRQNPWKSFSYKLDYVLNLNILHSPYGHSEEDCDLFVKNKNLRNPAEKFIRELKMNDIVLIPYKIKKKYELLIVKIKSHCKIKTFNELKVIIHNNLKNKNNENLKSVFSNQDLIEKMQHNPDYLCNTTIIPFTTIYRDIEILQRYDYENNSEIRRLLSNVRQSIIKKYITITI